MTQRQQSTPEQQAGQPPPANQGAATGEERPAPKAVPEIGGPKGPEPTRYGDWEKAGRCTDF